MKNADNIRASLRVTNLHEVALSTGVSYRELYWFVRCLGDASQDMLETLDKHLQEQNTNVG